jgi:hypothetical protein
VENRLVRSLLFGSSYLPIFPILMLLYWDAHPIGALVLGGCGLLLLGVCLWYFGRAVPSRSASTVILKQMYGRDGDVMSYVVTYLFPLLSVTLDTWKQFAALFLTLLVIGGIYVSSRMIYINPTLTLLLRLHLYEIAIEGREEMRFVLLTRREQPAFHVPISVVELGSGILVEKGRKP